ncbi:receptor-type tyrosine-protein phosphatase kappa isoform X3 [Xenopus laevis]|uniref:Tyrosine-protein phosphatase non-receptor type 20 n=1 Tax=Xenopus laevis TaxID=8355 RepID=A0A8J1M6G1_XENLA|nr:receptor-type tyrosine-protein phosphatase kappa isoform X3 [Xenopus laevis]
MSPSRLCCLLLLTLAVLGKGAKGQSNSEVDVQCHLSALHGIYRRDKEYYDPEESVTVQCMVGYYPKEVTIRCMRNGTSSSWDNHVHCTEQCKKSDLSVDPNVQLVPDKYYYWPRDEVSVRCKEGYKASHKTITCKAEHDKNVWNVTAPINCVEQCKKSNLSMDPNVQLVPPQDYYPPNTEVSVRCPLGYKPSRDTITCISAQYESVWDVNTLIRCVDQCLLSQINGINRTGGDKEYYYPEESVTVQCIGGYYPTRVTIKCMRNGAITSWDNRVPCTEQCKKSDLSMDPNVQLVPDKSYYWPNTEVSVRCQLGYKPSQETITCKSAQDKNVWDINIPFGCVAQCRLSQINGIYKTEGYKEYYDSGISVTVSCVQGYYPKYKTITCMRNEMRPKWDNLVPCTEQCKKSALSMDSNVQLVPDKSYYWPRDEVSVRCKEGYKASPNTITCKAEQYENVWDVTGPIHCVEQCAKPTGPGINPLSLNKDFYDQWEFVTVTCARGYHAISGAITCEWRGAHPNWNMLNPCIAFQVTVTRVTPTSISLQWECGPGPCQSYWHIGVSYETLGQSQGKSQTEIGTEGVTLSELQPYTEYIIIFFGNRRGKWTELERRTIRTKESAPGRPDFTQRPSVNDNNNILKWRLSETHGVLTGYQLNISAQREYDLSFSETESHWLRPNVREFNMELKHGTNYTVTLQGFTSAGPGEPAVWTHETPIAEPLKHQMNEIKLDKQTAMFILYPVPNQHGPISSYEIIISRGWNGSLSPFCSSYSSTRYNCSHTPSLYTALLLPAENVTGSRSLTLGDGLHYGSFYNAPLSPHQNYTVYLRVTSTWKQVNKSSCTRFDPFLIAGNQPLPPTLIGGLVGGGALLLLLVVLLAFCKLGLVRSAMCQSSFGLSNWNPMGNRNAHGKKKRDIPVDDLLEVVKRFRNEELLVNKEGDEENSNMLPVGRPKEYKELPSGPLYPCAAASSEQNKTKDRYKNVIPYDNCRVILRSNPSGSDYINASYIDGYKEPKFFIATQGPLPETLADFWHMVWQEKSSVIVMLTALEEQNKVKCERYWPEEIQTYGDIRVSVESTSQTGAFISRSFTLQKVGDSAQRTVEHLHYLQWPDHGVPSKPSGLLQLMDQMNKCKLPGSGPVIVHCSAGIGRTGTLLALDILLKRARAEGKVNVYDCALQMRRRRPNMIQNQGQYMFLYDVLLETLVCSSTSLPVEGVLTHMRHMQTLDPGTNTSGFTREFQAVEKLTELYRICSYREAHENHCKNLHPDIIPGDHCRPILMSVMDQHGAPGYINAVFINSNSQEDQFIVTQLPKLETLPDLWSLVWDYRCTSIIVMHPAQDIRRLCPHFWPVSGESTYSNFQVKKISSLRDSGFSGATLHLQHKKEPILEVQLWHLDSWPKDKPVPQNPGAIISLIGKVERLQQQDKESHVLVICSDGATRSGIFCAGSLICDQIRSDGFLDVSQSVRSLKKRRRQLIPNVDQYSFCYSLAKTYLDSFETYGNFQ